MAKKRKGSASQNKLAATLVASLLGIAAICFLLAPALVFKSKLGDATTSYTGFQLIFGCSEGDSVRVTLFNFNFLAFLTLIFLAAGVLFGLFNFKNLPLKLLPAGTFVLGGVFLFLMSVFAPIAVEGGSDAWTAMTLLFDPRLGWGAIVGGICSLLAAAISAVKVFLAK